ATNVVRRKTSASMSSTIMLLNALTTSSCIVFSVTQAAISNASCVSQYVTCRRVSSTKRSTIRISAAAVRMTTSGITAKRLCANGMSEFALRGVREKIGDRRVHHVDERLRPNAHREQHHEGGELRHRVDDAAVIADQSAVQPVVHHADAKEQSRRHEAVRNHLHEPALHAELTEQ